MKQETESPSAINKSELPTLSIMIPVYNEARFIVSTLEQLYEQHYPKSHYEVLVVDGCSTDETMHLAKQFAEQHTDLDIQVLSNPGKLSSCARNIAVKTSKHDYILLIDGHVHLPSQQLLSHYAQAAQSSGAKVLGRPQPLNPPGISSFQQLVARARTSPLAHSGESFIYSQFSGFTSPLSIGVMYHRSVFGEVGLFDEEFDAAEDLEFNYRLEAAGYQCYTAPDLAVSYFPRDSLTALFKQLSRYGLGRARFVNKHPKRFSWETIVPSAFFVLVCLTPLALIVSTWSRGLWVLGAAVYLIAIGFEGIRLCVGFNKIKAASLASIIATVHLGLGWGFLHGLWKIRTKHKRATTIANGEETNS